MWDEYTYHKLVPQKASFQFLPEAISLFTLGVNKLQISLGTYFSKRVSPMPYEKRGIALWVECTRHKAGPWKTFLQFLSDRIFFFTLSLNAHMNVSFHAKDKQF